jgi:uncharacterized protein involved in oxidation of intracellular sulfur
MTGHVKEVVSSGRLNPDNPHLGTASQSKTGRERMKLGIVISQTDPETVFNTLRLARFSLEQGDEVRIFLSGKGVEIDQIDDPRFDVKGQAQQVLNSGGQFYACGTCLKLRNSEGSEVCPLSTLKDHYEIVRDSDKVITI